MPPDMSCRVTGVRRLLSAHRPQARGPTLQAEQYPLSQFCTKLDERRNRASKPQPSPSPLQMQRRSRRPTPVLRRWLSAETRKFAPSGKTPPAICAIVEGSPATRKPIPERFLYRWRFPDLVEERPAVPSI